MRAWINLRRTMVNRRAYLLLMAWWQSVRFLFTRHSKERDTDDSVLDLAVEADSLLIPVDDTESQPLQRKNSTVISSKRNQETLDATWHFRGDILDYLDEYFSCFRKLRHLDSDSYALFKRVGLSMTRAFYSFSECDFTGLKRIAIGGVACPFVSAQGGRQSADRVTPSLWYFRKLVMGSEKTPVRMLALLRAQRTGGDIYEVTVVFDDRYRTNKGWRSDLSYPFSYYIHIKPDNTAELLKEPVLLTHKVQPGLKRRNGHKRDTFSLKEWRWQIPSFLQNWAKDSEGGQALNGDPSLFAIGHLHMLLKTHARATSKIVVRVGYEKEHVNFGIELPRAKYFFADRDNDVLAADGKRKRIFHYVSEHSRLVKGKLTSVREHYRGLRSFVWNGYDINIVLPTNRFIFDFDVPGQLCVEDSLEDEMLDGKATGKRLAEYLEA